jgi:hypothetical protein
MSYKDRVGLDRGGRIRPYGSGRDCSCRSGRNDTIRAIGSRESDASVVSRLMVLRPAYARMRNARTISMLIVCATAIIIVSATVLAFDGKANATVPNTSGSNSDHQLAPGAPFLVRGIINDTVGNPQPGCDVKITNKRTGEFGTYVSEFDGYYEYDMQVGTTSGILPLDTVNVTATLGTLIGWAEAQIPDPAGPYINIDVTLHEGGAPIPEFPTVIVPVAGMLALFAVVSLRRRGEE